MFRFARSALVVLTVLATLIVSALSGRVLCVNGPEHIALENVHTESHDDGHHHHEGESHESDRCMDIQSDATLVREGTASPLQNLHFLLAPMLTPPVLTPALLPLDARPLAVPHSGPPPAFDDLTRLGDIILLV